MNTPVLTARMNAFAGGDDDSGSGGEGRVRKHLQKYPTNGDLSLNSRMSQSASTMAMANARPTTTAQRKSSARDYKPPLGPRPLNLSPKRVASDAPSFAPSLQNRSMLPTSTSDTFLAHPSRRRNTTHDFIVPSASDVNEPQETERIRNPLQFDFDDSYEDDSREPVLRGDFPMPDIGSRNSPANDLPRTSSKDVSATPLSLAESRRTSSLTSRTEGVAKRAAQLSAASGVNSTSASASHRTRRQSQFPISATNPNLSRQPRKSVGPDVIPGGNERSFLGLGAQSTISTSSTAANIKLNQEITKARARLSPPTTVAGARNENKVFLSSDRRPRVQSLQVATLRPQRKFGESLGPRVENSSGAANGFSTPGRQISQQATTPSGTRQSIHSAHSPHVGGLGARTISPTDTKRMKRMSIVNSRRAPIQNPQTPDISSNAAQAAETPPPMPQNLVTSASVGETPDLTPRAVSGRSVSSRSSYSSCRPTSSTPQPRPNPSVSSRPIVPTTSPRTTSTETELVPPVPAIPKVYESPSEQQLEQPFFSSETTSKNREFVEEELPTEAPSNLRTSWFDNRQKRGLTVGSRPDLTNSGTGQRAGRSNLQPLRLPPLNLFPLNSSTTSRTYAELRESPDRTNGEVTPPLKRTTLKTPATPMTASKATFPSSSFSYSDLLGSLPFLRSTTSHDDSLTRPDTSEEVENVSPSKEPEHFRDAPSYGLSPFVSSSVPKQSLDGGAPRTIETDSHQIVDTSVDTRGSRFSNFRSQLSGRLSKETRPAQAPNATSNDVSAMGPPLRRKLSRGWRRSSSKASQGSQQNDDEFLLEMPKTSNMLPPKIPPSSSSTEPLRLSPILQDQTPSNPQRSRNYSVNALDFKTTETLFSEDGEGASYKEKPVLERSLHITKDGGEPLVSTVKESTHRPSISNLRPQRSDSKLDRDDLAAEEEMKRLASRRKDFETAAREVDDLKKRASPKERVSPSEAVRLSNLNIFERGEVIDYKEIYFCGNKSAKKFVGDLNAQASNFGFDDERGDYNLVMGDHLAYRYEVIDMLGKGSFGQVVRCIDHKSGKLVAIKIIRNKKRFHQQALVEVNILQKLRDWDPQCQHSMIHFTQSFYFRGHLCISTELLGMNLYEFIKAHEFRGFSLKLIRRFTKQLLSSLALLQGRRVIHCDLKPENILLVHPMHSEIKVIDFGSSCFENEKVYTYIQSRFYRSPEVILGMTYGLPIDMWSVGCILAELLTGYPIFPGENEQEQLACIMEVFGPPEKHLIEKSTRKKLFFDSMGKPRVTVSSKGKRRRPSSKTLQQALKCDDEAFVDFIARCLRWDPDRRLKPDDALNHWFVTGVRKASRARTSGASSPVKRVAMAPTPSRPRPLPEPPTSTFKNGTASSNVPVAIASPTKNSASRRHSTMTGLVSATGNKKPLSSAAAAAGLMTGLPRVAQRSASGRPDLASAAAIASLRQR